MTVLNVCICRPRQVHLGNCDYNSNEQILLASRFDAPSQVHQPLIDQPPPPLQHLSRRLLRPREDCLRVNLIILSHTFCYICIENWAANNKSCPLCKCRFKRKLEKDLIALNIIDDLLAECAHSNCKWTGTYARVKTHQRLCPYRPKKAAQVLGGEVVELENFQVRPAVVNLEESADGQWQDSQESYGQ